MRHAFRHILVAIVAVLLVFPAAASAAPANAQWDKVDVIVHVEGGSNIVIVAGELPASAKLPATVQLAVPAGGEFQWAGEILGGDVSADPSVTYEVERAGDSDIYSFTLTKSRIGQVEVLLPSVVTFDGSAYSANLNWTAPDELKKLDMSVRVTQGAQVQTAAEGASIVPGPPGYSYYQKQVSDLKKGQSESLAFTYTQPAGAVPAAPNAPAGQAGGNSGLALAAVIVVFGAAFLFAARAVQRKMQGAAYSDSDDEVFADDDESAADYEQADEEVADAVELVDDGADELPEEDASETVVAARSKTAMVTWAVAGALVVAVVAAIYSGGAATQTGDTVVMQYAQVDACTTSDITLAVPAGGDVSRDADKILSSLRQLAGVGTATLHLKEARVEVAYCSSSADEQQIVQALNASGYSAAGVQTQ
jgi:copper chaperone CopZ